MEIQRSNNTRNQPNITPAQEMPRSLNDDFKLHQETLFGIVALDGGFKNGLKTLLAFSMRYVVTNVFHVLNST